jgi:hypothetical protein
MTVSQEMKQYGVFNLINALSFAPAGYILYKFVAVSHGVIQNITDRRPGIVYTGFLAAIYFSGFPIINYMPRYFLCQLVVRGTSLCAA